MVTYNAGVFIPFSFLPLSPFFAFLLLCRFDGHLSRVLDEDFYKQPFSELIGYVYVAPTNTSLFHFDFAPLIPPPGIQPLNHFHVSCLYLFYCL